MTKAESLVRFISVFDRACAFRALGFSPEFVYSVVHMKFHYER